MGAQVSVVHADLMAKAARTNYAGAGGTKMGTWKIEDVASRLSKIDANKFFEPWEGSNTTLLFEAAQTGGHECLAVIQILRKNAKTYEQFISSLSWRDKNGRTPLHVCNHGESAAALLLSGCTSLNTIEFTKGYTPLLSATARYKPDVCAVLKFFGADLDARDVENKQTAEEMAIWLKYPIERGSGKCLSVLRDEVDFASFGGIQWLFSPEIHKELNKVGVQIVHPNAGKPNETNLNLGVLIKNLPEEMRYKAELYDTDLSGSISFEDLEKIDPKRTLVGHHKKNFKMQYDPKMEHAFHESFFDVHNEDKTKVIEKFALQQEDYIEADETVDENTLLNIADLPEHLKYQAMSWDTTSSGKIKMKQLYQIDAEFCEKLLSQKPVMLDITGINERKNQQQLEEERVSFARYQKNTRYGKNYSMTPARREMNGVVPNLPNSNRKNQETMGLLG